MANDDAPILHLVVIGFHHKKGYQVSSSVFEKLHILLRQIDCVLFVFR